MTINFTRIAQNNPIATSLKILLLVSFIMTCFPYILISFCINIVIAVLNLIQ